MFWTWMLSGNVAVVIGVLMSTLGAGFLFADDPHKAPLSRAQALVAIFIGTLVATSGGLATTYAWNLNSTAETRAMLAEAEADRLLSQRHAITGQALIDIMWNANALKQPMFTETDPERLKEYIVLQSLAAESVTAIVTSGLFLAPQERPVLIKAIALRERLRLAETVTDTLRSELLRFSNRPEEISKLRIAARDATAFQRVNEAGGELIEAIATWQAAVKPKHGASSAKQPTAEP